MAVLDPSWVGNAVAGFALLLSGLSLRRSSTKEDAAATDVRIDERIQLKFGVDIAVIKNEVQNIAKSLSSNGDLVRNTVNATTNAITEAAETMLKINKS